MSRAVMSLDLLVDIIETLESYGLDQDEFRLYNSVDVEALEELLHSSNGDVEVEFTVEDVRLSVTSESVNILSNDENYSFRDQ